MNRGLNPNNTSGFKGVSWHKLTGKWYSRLRIGDVPVHQQLHATKEEAAAAYNEAAKTHFGEFAFLNPIQNT